jgi:hypothetical protein
MRMLFKELYIAIIRVNGATGRIVLCEDADRFGLRDV